eukprot:TRINITY_DN15606_c0_g3_i1.p1 TRINITY_DN15606_c0_g3~~TRINITY_DN15606_c0_g3_i1.p1  ORF type:complete len:1209 (+),score=210.87 TRINITY_DN15606_c0_g3_i1:90-3716(+)
MRVGAPTVRSRVRNLLIQQRAMIRGVGTMNAAMASGPLSRPCSPVGARGSSADSRCNSPLVLSRGSVGPQRRTVNVYSVGSGQRRHHPSIGSVPVPTRTVRATTAIAPGYPSRMTCGGACGGVALPRGVCLFGACPQAPASAVGANGAAANVALPSRVDGFRGGGCNGQHMVGNGGGSGVGSARTATPPRTSGGGAGKCVDGAAAFCQLNSLPNQSPLPLARGRIMGGPVLQPTTVSHTQGVRVGGGWGRCATASPCHGTPESDRRSDVPLRVLRLASPVRNQRQAATSPAPRVHTSAVATPCGSRAGGIAGGGPLDGLNQAIEQPMSESLASVDGIANRRLPERHSFPVAQSSPLRGGGVAAASATATAATSAAPSSVVSLDDRRGPGDAFPVIQRTSSARASISAGDRPCVATAPAVKPVRRVSQVTVGVNPALVESAVRTRTSEIGVQRKDADAMKDVFGSLPSQANALTTVDGIDAASVESSTCESAASKAGGTFSSLGFPKTKSEASKGSGLADSESPGSEVCSGFMYTAGVLMANAAVPCSVGSSDLNSPMDRQRLQRQPDIVDFLGCDASAGAPLGVDAINRIGLAPSPAPLDPLVASLAAEASRWDSAAVLTRDTADSDPRPSTPALAQAGFAALPHSVHEDELLHCSSQARLGGDKGTIPSTVSAVACGGDRLESMLGITAGALTTKSIELWSRVNCERALILGTKTAPAWDEANSKDLVDGKKAPEDSEVTEITNSTLDGLNHLTGGTNSNAGDIIGSLASSVTGDREPLQSVTSTDDENECQRLRNQLLQSQKIAEIERRSWEAEREQLRSELLQARGDAKSEAVTGHYTSYGTSDVAEARGDAKREALTGHYSCYRTSDVAEDSLTAQLATVAALDNNIVTASSSSPVPPLGDGRRTPEWAAALSEPVSPQPFSVDRARYDPSQPSHQPQSQSCSGVSCSGPPSCGAAVQPPQDVLPMFGARDGASGGGSSSSTIPGGGDSGGGGGIVGSIGGDGDVAAGERESTSGSVFDTPKACSGKQSVQDGATEYEKLKKNIRDAMETLMRIESNKDFKTSPKGDQQPEGTVASVDCNAAVNSFASRTPWHLTERGGGFDVGVAQGTPSQQHMLPQEKLYQESSPWWRRGSHFADNGNEAHIGEDTAVQDASTLRVAPPSTGDSVGGSGLLKEESRKLVQGELEKLREWYRSLPTAAMPTSL